VPLGTTVGGLITAAALLSASGPSATMKGMILGGAGRFPLGGLTGGTHIAVAVLLVAGLLFHVQSLYAGVRSAPRDRS
jgi:hypothetical protein